jgi:aromatic-L-amino-acid/L-tryptophan decarboxylase
LKDNASGLDWLNEALLDRVNASGEIFLSHTHLNGRYALRLAVGHIRTSEAHVARAWELLRETADHLIQIGLHDNSPGWRTLQK